MSATADTARSPGCSRRHRSGTGRRERGPAPPSTSAGCRGSATIESKRPSCSAVERALADEDLATCSCSCQASARSRGSGRTPRASLPGSGRRSAAGGASSLEDQDLALGTVAAGRRRRRARHRHRRDVAHRRGRAASSSTAVWPGRHDRHRDRDDPADDGVDQPATRRTSVRPRRAHRAGRRLPAVVEDRARQPPGPPRGRDRLGRPRRIRPRTGRLGHDAGRLSFADPPPASAWHAALELLRDGPGAGDAGGTRRRLGRAMVAAPASIPGWPASVAGAPLRWRAWSPPSSTSATSCAARDRPAADRSRLAGRGCGHTRTPSRSPGPSSGTGPGSRHRPAVGSGSSPTRSTPTAPGCCCSPASPTARRRRRPGQFQLRTGNGAWVADDDPWRRRRSSSPPTDGKRSEPASTSPASRRSRSPALLDGSPRTSGLEWDADRDDLVGAGRAARSTRSVLGEDGRSPGPGVAPANDGGTRRRVEPVQRTVSTTIKKKKNR